MFYVLKGGTKLPNFFVHREFPEAGNVVWTNEGVYPQKAKQNKMSKLYSL